MALVALLLYQPELTPLTLGGVPWWAWSSLGCASLLMLAGGVLSTRSLRLARAVATAACLGQLAVLGSTLR